MPQKSTAKKLTAALVIRELKSKAEQSLIYPLIKQLNKDMSKSRFEECLTQMRPLGYRCIGAFEGKKLVGACGFWVGTRFWCGKFIDLDHVVVDENLRSKGVGKAMVAWVEREGRALECSQAGLDSYSTAYGAHRFYFREGYSILGYHFVKSLKSKP